MSKEEIQEAIKYNLDYLEGNISIENELEEAQKEIERLNNIIYNLEDKLNKLIEEQLEQYNKRVENWKERRNVSNTWLTSRDCYYSILKYLQKLKGVDKE